MAKGVKKFLTGKQQEDLFKTLKARFEKNRQRHKDLNWSEVQKKLEANEEKLWSIQEMEKTGGEPDVIGYDSKEKAYIFCDCAEESPKGRRSLCYDREALDSRKEFKPGNTAIDMAKEMGIELLTEEAYHALQLLGPFDLKTSSWLQTPDSVRKLGGAIFADYRFGRVFVYHNGASSYYAARGFRGILKV